MTKQTLTVIIPTLNEEQNIARAIKSALWADKVVVLDSGSQDRTLSIAKQYPIKIKSVRPNQLFKGVQEEINKAAEDCGTDWVLRLDADEEISIELQKEITEILQKDNNDVIAYGLPRREYFLGDYLQGGDWAYDRLIRLYRPKFAHYTTVAAVHEQYQVDGKKSVLRNQLNHFSHPSRSEINRKWNLYTSLEAKDLKISKLEALYCLIIQPPYVFLRWLIWHKGIVDGPRGVLAALFRGYYEFLKYSKYLGLISIK